MRYLMSGIEHEVQQSECGQAVVQDLQHVCGLLGIAFGDLPGFQYGAHQAAGGARHLRMVLQVLL